ncbi:hypothetical protein LOTGIDRAFT_236370 [Lottia gigantea]|uniref:Uncharacterized protein n=1 Tax=Lottia gigantea TaxID=225164 RepID=V3ZN47_LOTGI|nr:hypothetical protein LOTGIDRAFT_236370 [Lottia gigantea]ESO83845.1 hypothetical protein LOTGIDRAFT_236370 [Lottia gigantea]
MIFFVCRNFLPQRGFEPSAFSRRDGDPTRFQPSFHSDWEFVEIEKMAQMIQVEQSVMSSNDVTSIMATFEVNDDLGLVLVPLDLFISTPTSICDAFQLQTRTITHDENLINVFVDNNVIYPSNLGMMDKLTETWTIKGESDEFLEKIINLLSTRATMLSFTLNQTKLKGDDSNLHFLAFIKPSAPSMTSLIDYLYIIKKDEKHSRKFAIELDIGPTIERWCRAVFGQDMTCIGGRLGVTSGEMFNPIFNWNVVVGILPCLPVTLLASLVYRASRKAKYRVEKKIETGEVTCLLGSRSIDIDDQREALSDLTRIAVTLSVEKCRRCGLLLRLDEFVPTCCCPDNKLRLLRQSSTQEQTTSFVANDDSELPDDIRQKILEFHRFTASGRVETVRLDENHRHSIDIDSNPRISISQVDVNVTDKTSHCSDRRQSLLTAPGSRRGSLASLDGARRNSLLVSGEGSRRGSLVEVWEACRRHPLTPSDGLQRNQPSGLPLGGDLRRESFINLQQREHSNSVGSDDRRSGDDYARNGTRRESDVTPSNNQRQSISQIQFELVGDEARLPEW